ncbi:hypothetical protein AAJ76_8200014826 [Vairimorpha ceranae]|uniref:Uncharacterized protein n=1 Tax=Vairimorpha ceranae TaxID=40302 RepID=A0A0F9W9J1_9MICR|nr:hypothetical protein AAJ76_8200014826 [Vairimorpha ceranae]KKO74336.1 hypothetical protein AAJ76_8200014826 [Vairimorpha ceranae]
MGDMNMQNLYFKKLDAAVQSTVLKYKSHKDSESLKMANNLKKNKNVF